MVDRMAIEYTKYTVNLIPRAMEALSRAAQLNEDTRTDTINRAIQVYEYLTRLQAEGWDLLVRNDKGEINRITLL